MAGKPKRVEPAHLWIPERTKSAGAAATTVAEMAGIALDAEQQLALDAVLSVRGDKWAALEAAIIMARQNGKTLALQAVALAGLFLLQERLIVWSAHLFPTTQEAFRDMVTLIEGAPDLSKRVKRVSSANGEEAIELHGDRRIMFKARTKTGGRGLTGDRVILDEAFALDPAMMGSLFPTMSARRNPQIVYASSAGLVGSGILRGLRDRGRAGGDPTLAYVEWCAPEGGCADDDCDHHVGAQGCVADDPDMWRLANPTLGRRISVGYVGAERRALPPEEFCRERLGWWDDPADVADGLPLEKWAGCAEPDAEPVAPLTIAVDVAPSHSSASIVVCGGPLEVIDHRRGASWVPDRLAEITQDTEFTAIGLDPSGPAGALMPDLESAGFLVRSKSEPNGHLVLIDGRDLVQACGAIYTATVEGQLVHRDQPILNDAVAGAHRRQVSDAWKWSRRDSSVDISPLVAATIARFLWSQPERFAIQPGVAGDVDEEQMARELRAIEEAEARALESLEGAP